MKGKGRVFKFKNDVINEGEEDTGAEWTNKHNTTTTDTTTKPRKEKTKADDDGERRDNSDSGPKRRRRQTSMEFLETEINDR